MVLGRVKLFGKERKLKKNLKKGDNCENMNKIKEDLNLYKPAARPYISPLQIGLKMHC